MGYAARANKLGISIEEKRNRILKRSTFDNPHQNKTKVHIPRTDMKAVDVFEIMMCKGMRPMTPDERQQAVNQGMDFTPPDVKEKQVVRELTKDPEVRLIHLTDE